MVEQQKQMDKKKHLKTAYGKFNFKLDGQAPFSDEFFHDEEIQSKNNANDITKKHI